MGLGRGLTGIALQARRSPQVLRSSLPEVNKKTSAIGKSAAADAERLKNSPAGRVSRMVCKAAAQHARRRCPDLGGGMPGLPGSLPERPDISLPGGIGLDNFGSAPPPGETTPAFPPPARPRITGHTAPLLPVPQPTRNPLPRAVPTCPPNLRTMPKQTDPKPKQ